MSAAAAKAKEVKPEQIMTTLEMKAIVRAFRIKFERFRGVYIARFESPLLLIPGPTRVAAVAALLREIGEANG